jgi:hypothetical protein
VLLMHLGAFDARLMPRLLQLYRDKGFRFVSLAEAERDPIYRAELNPALAPGPQGLDQAAAGKGVSPPPVPPLPAFDALCR